MTGEATILGNEPREMQMADFLCRKCDRGLNVSHGGNVNSVHGIARCGCGAWTPFRELNNVIQPEAERTKSRVCPNCKTTAGFKRLWEWPPEGEGQTGADEEVSALDRCSACGSVAYFKSDRDGTRVIDQYPKEIIEPQKELPDSVKPAYREALVCYSAGAPNGALLMCRRAIQEALDNLGAKKGDLPTQLSDLVTKYKITPNLKEWADHARIGGKLAAHGTDDGEWGDPGSVYGDKDDAEAVIEFCNGFFEYVYVLPKRNEERRSRTKTQPT